MEFIEKFKSVLPDTISFSDIYELCPSELWEQNPQKAATIALQRAGIFDQEAYLAQYNDVKRLNINAIEHFVLYGLDEGREFIQIEKVKKKKRSKRQELKLLEQKEFEIEEEPTIKEIKEEESNNINNESAEIRQEKIEDEREEETEEENKKEFLISVIISVYNDADYIESAVQSLYQNDFRDFEIILIDDGSTDASYKTMLDVKDLYDNILVLQQEHSNAGVARNLGMQHAHGQYVLFLDVDDIYNPEILSEYSQKIQSCDYPDIVFSKYAVSKQGEMYHYGKPKIHLDELETHNFAEDKTSLYNITNSTLWTKIFNVDFIKKYDINCQDLPTCNDIGFCFTALYLANSIYYIDKELVTYRHTRTGSISEKRYLEPENVFLSYDFIKNNIQKYDKFNEETFYETFVQSLVWEFNLENTSALRNDFIALVHKYLPAKYCKQFFEKVISVSIILPIDSTNSNVKDTIQSLSQQKLKASEIIIVDNTQEDSDEDNSQDYTELDKRIRFYKNEDSKDIVTAKNLGAKEALGKYILFVEPGDILRTGNLKKLYETANNNEADLCLFDPSQQAENEEREYDYNELLKLAFTNFKLKMLYKRDYLIDNELFFTQSIFNEKLDQQIKSMLGTQKIILVENILYKNVNEASEHDKLTKDNYPDIEKYLDNIKELIDNDIDFIDVKAVFLQFAKLIIESHVDNEDQDFMYNTYASKYDD
ncbi:MAG: glycosyltransferase [Desulfovibrio sp.]|nr:glycosyltransferase [Desulfovibrio sp.]